MLAEQPEMFDDQ